MSHYLLKKINTVNKSLNKCKNKVKLTTEADLMKCTYVVLKKMSTENYSLKQNIYNNYHL